MESLIKGYEPRDVFDADEAGLLFEVQAAKTLSLKGEACQGGKCSEERLDSFAVLQLEWFSEMMKPWAIPRCFKNIRHLPCHYRNISQAWMTFSVFEEFLSYMDLKMGCRNRQVILSCIVKRPLENVEDGQQPTGVTILNALFSICMERCHCSHC